MVFSVPITSDCQRDCGVLAALIFCVERTARFEDKTGKVEKIEVMRA